MLKRKGISLFVFLILGVKAFASFDFYGHTIDLSIKPASSNVVKSPLNQQNISDLKQSLSDKYSFDLYHMLLRERKRFDLDDMGLLVLLKKATASITTDRNVAKVLQYDVLRKLHFQAILTYSINGLDLFGALDRDPARSVYVFYEGDRYTNLEFNDNRLAGQRKVFRDPTNEILQKLKLQNRSTPKIDAKLSKKVIIWSYKNKIYRIDAVTNHSVTEYLKDLPLLDVGKTYVEQGHSPQFESSVLNTLRTQLLTFQTTDEKADFLLNFVQLAFRYKTDEEQYGKEKYNYPEETLASDFSDCEDRTLLLAFLFKKLMNVNCVGLYFAKDKHICLAAALPNRSNTYTFKYQNTPFVVCEPTGPGYQLGESGLDLKRITEVIPLY